LKLLSNSLWILLTSDCTVNPPLFFLRTIGSEKSGCSPLFFCINSYQT